jgi:hypothetical protein
MLLPDVQSLQTDLARVRRAVSGARLARALRHQLNILRRNSPKKLALRVRPETLSRIAQLP